MAGELVSDQSQKAVVEFKPEPKTNEVAVADLFKQAEPLVKYWAETEKEKHRLEFEYENNLLRVVGKQNSLMSIGLFALLGLIFVIGGVLIYVGQPDSAMDLIKLVVSLAGAAFGGYGWAMVKRRVADDKGR